LHGRRVVLKVQFARVMTRKFHCHAIDSLSACQCFAPMSKVTLSAENKTILAQLFKPKIQTQAREKLKALKSNQVVSSVLALSQGTVDRLLHFANVARREPRDIIF
jgi:hypothetical protein